MEANLAIPNGCKLAAQKAWWSAVLRGRPNGVDDADASTRLERWSEVIEQAVRLCDFVIHVHQDRSVERMSRQPRIVRLTEADGDVLQPKITHSIAQAPQIFWHNVFCDDAPVGSDDRRQPHDVVAATCTDVIPGSMPSSCTSWRGSPAASRSSSLRQIGLTISATGRSGFGKAPAGAPDGAMKFWAAPRVVNAAASGHVATATPKTVKNSRRLMSDPRLRTRHHTAETSTL